MSKKKKGKETLIHFILDKSGSMTSVWDATISGFNEYLQGLKNQKGSIRFSLTLFDTVSIEKRYNNVSLEEVKPLNRDSYIPNGGTPLYDAVISSVEDLCSQLKDSHKNPAVAVVIMTDGQENASKEHTEKCLKEIVELLEKTGEYTFAYMGANQDAWANAAKIGISSGNTMSWNSTMEGTGTAFRSLAMASADYAANINAGAKGMTTAFFKQPDLRKESE